jgi:hypothetical protein
VDAALQADLGGPAVPGFERAPFDFVEIEDVRAAAQVLAQLAFGEGAELAFEIADVGVVDVAVDDVGDGVAGGGAAQLVGGGGDAREVVATGSEQANDVGFAETAACAGAI